MQLSFDLIQPTDTKVWSYAAMHEPLKCNCATHSCLVLVGVSHGSHTHLVITQVGTTSRRVEYAARISPLVSVRRIKNSGTHNFTTELLISWC